MKNVNFRDRPTLFAVISLSETEFSPIRLRIFQISLRNSMDTFLGCDSHAAKEQTSILLKLDFQDDKEPQILPNAHEKPYYHRVVFKEMMLFEDRSGFCPDSSGGFPYQYS